MQAYIDGLNGMLPQVKAAFAPISSLLPQSGAMQLALNGMLSQGLPAAIELPEPTAAYASGTESAARGWALVGEQGPELLFMQGGERILTHQETEHIFRQEAQSVQTAPQPELARIIPTFENGGKDNVQISVAPVYNLSGIAAHDEVREVLQQHDDNLRELIREALADWQADRRRLAFI